MVILSKTGRSQHRIDAALQKIEAQGFPILSATWGLRDGLQSEFDLGGVGLESSNPYLCKIAESVGRAMLKRVFS
jgi:hypothetical protein